MSRPSVDLEKAYPTPPIELGARNGASSRDDDEAAQAFLPKTTARAPAQPPKLNAAMISTSSRSGARCDEGGGIGGTYNGG